MSVTGLWSYRGFRDKDGPGSGFYVSDNVCVGHDRFSNNRNEDVKVSTEFGVTQSFIGVKYSNIVSPDAVVDVGDVADGDVGVADVSGHLGLLACAS